MLSKVFKSAIWVVYTIFRQTHINWLFMPAISGQKCMILGRTLGSIAAQESLREFTADEMLDGDNLYEVRKSSATDKKGRH